MRSNRTIVPRELRYIVDGGLPGAVNMARDEAVATAIGPGDRGVLRVYSFEPPCITRGRSQDDFHIAGIESIRRPTGGLSILHEYDFTYCIALPRGQGVDRDACFSLVAEALAGALSMLGIEATVSDRRGDQRSGTWCFASAFGIDIETGGRKICGSAQRVYPDSILQHGSLILSASELSITDEQGRDASGAIMTLERAAGRPVSRDEVRESLEHSFTSRLGVRLIPSRMTDSESELEARLLAGA